MQASKYIQMIQKTLNDSVYTTFLNKQKNNMAFIQEVLNKYQVNNKYFSLVLQNQKYILTIQSQRLYLTIKVNSNNQYIITCNHSNLLCRKLYHRKQKK